MSKTVVGLRVRLPVDAKAFLEAEAQENASSQNSEIVRAVRAAMKAKGPVSVEALPSHVTTPSPQKEEANEQLPE